MNVHKNAQLTPRGRAQMVEPVLIHAHTPKAVVTAFGVCQRTVRKWVQRFRNEGKDGRSEPHQNRVYSPRQSGVDRNAGLFHH